MSLGCTAMWSVGGKDGFDKIGKWGKRKLASCIQLFRWYESIVKEGRDANGGPPHQG